MRWSQRLTTDSSFAFFVGAGFVFLLGAILSFVLAYTLPASDSLSHGAGAGVGLAVSAVVAILVGSFLSVRARMNQVTSIRSNFRDNSLKWQTLEKLPR